MPHPLVDQLRFTRSEWLRALDGVSEDDAARRLLPMNSIGWIVGHLAWQEQRYWLTFGQGRTPLPSLNEVVGYGRPATTPPLAEMLAAWHAITQTSEPWLDQITTAKLVESITVAASGRMPKSHAPQSRARKSMRSASERSASGGSTSG